VEAILNPSRDGECTSESRHRPYISFCFSWLEDPAGVATGAWENSFFFLSRNVHSPEFWLDTLATCDGELGNLKTAIEEAQQVVTNGW